MNNDPHESFNVRLYLEVLARHKLLILTFCLSAALTSLALTYIFSEKYRAATTILYQPQEAITFRPKMQQALGYPMPLVPLESIGNTLEEVAKSDGVVERVVMTLKLDQKKKKPESNWFIATFREVKDKVKEYGGEAWQILKYGRILDKDPFRDAIVDLKSKLTLKRASKAYTFSLETLDNDPQTAAAIVNTVGQILGEFLQKEKAHVARQETEKIESRLRENEAEIVGVRRALDHLKETAQVSSVKEEISLKLKALDSLREESSKLQSELRAMQHRYGELSAQLGQQEPSVQYSSTTTANPVAESMKLELAKLEVERSGLLQRFAPAHKEVKTVEAKLEQVRGRLQQEVEKVFGSESMRLNDIYQKVLSEKLTLEAEMLAAREKDRALREVISQQRHELKSLTGKEPRLADLALRLETAEHSYQMINEAYEEARIAEARATNEVAVLHQALVPSAPARPIKILHVGTTTLLSLLLAVGFAFFLNFFDSTMRRIDQVERTLNLPVLATIPSVVGKGHQAEQLLLKTSL